MNHSSDMIPDGVLSQGQEIEMPAHPRQEESSAVNAQGMWKSWQRNFTSPFLAMLDLFDNAMDATMATAGFQERMMIRIFLDEKQDQSTLEEHSNGICMINNCTKRIPPLRDVLAIHKSAKGDTDQIGENGVGVKQACAALSRLSFVLTKNKKEYGIGVLAFDLQEIDKSPYLPSYNFIREDDGSIHYALTQRICNNDALEHVVALYGNGDLDSGILRLENHLTRMCSGVWAEHSHVFMVILCDLLHGDGAYEGGAREALQELKTELPRYYLHVPLEFDVQVGGESIAFDYWQRRLVELTKFTSKLDPIHSWKKAYDWDWPADGYQIQIYVGFDVYRSDGKASLCIHSRKSGRLIKHVADARHLLGLDSGGTTFAQGLTVICDDILGRLPLTPTKQDLAFGHEKEGRVHEENLLAWLGAYTHLYYHTFLDMYTKKRALKEEVASHVDEMRNSDVSNRLLAGKFNTMMNLSFRRRFSPSQNIRCTRTNVQEIEGQDTVVRIRRPQPSATVRAKSTSTPRQKLRTENVAAVPEEPMSALQQTSVLSQEGLVIQPPAVAAAAQQLSRRRKRTRQWDNDDSSYHFVDKTSPSDSPEIDLCVEDDSEYEDQEDAQSSTVLDLTEETSDQPQLAYAPKSVEVDPSSRQRRRLESKENKGVRAEFHGRLAQAESQSVDQELQQQLEAWKDKHSLQEEEIVKLKKLLQERAEECKNLESEIFQVRQELREERIKQFREVEEKERSHRARYSELQRQLNNHMVDSNQQVQEMEERYDKQQKLLRDELKSEREKNCRLQEKLTRYAK